MYTYKLYYRYEHGKEDHGGLRHMRTLPNAGFAASRPRLVLVTSKGYRAWPFDGSMYVL